MDTTERVTVAAGVGTNGAAWSLAWPVDQWDRISQSDQAEVIRRQTERMERGSINEISQGDGVKRWPGIGSRYHPPGDD
jgi:hypothetical protein